MTSLGLRITSSRTTKPYTILNQVSVILTLIRCIFSLQILQPDEVDKFVEVIEKEKEAEAEKKKKEKATGSAK